MLLRSFLKLGGIFERIGSNAAKLSSMASVSPPRIVWIDMEMTGLDVSKDHIMEVACLVTDSNLRIVAEGPEIIVHQPGSVLDSMHEWCIKQHGQTGLTEACRTSTVSLQDAEESLYNFISKYVPEKCSPLAGNTVYMDRLFLRQHMPRVDSYLHYRIIDVSTIKELCRMWNPEVSKGAPAKQFQHRALQDIKESVEELKFYRNNFFLLGNLSHAIRM